MSNENYELLVEANINSSYRYGNIELPPERLMDIIQILNIKKHWWSKREDKSLQELLRELFELVEVKLSYFPNGFGFDVVFVENNAELHAIQQQRYNEVRYKDVSAFASLTANTMYVRIDRLNRNVLKHEFGHLLFHRMVDSVRVSSDLHERVAQFCET